VVCTLPQSLVVGTCRVVTYSDKLLITEPAAQPDIHSVTQDKHTHTVSLSPLADTCTIQVGTLTDKLKVGFYIFMTNIRDCLHNASTAGRWCKNPPHTQSLIGGC
jgi:hypothetical protein